MRISIDIDGVLAKFTPDSIRPLVREHLGKEIPEGYEPKDWEHTDIFTKKDWDQIWRVIENTPNFWFRYLVPDEENVKETQEFIRRNFGTVDVFYVTKRAKAAGLTLTSQTNIWLGSRGLISPQTATIVVPEGMTKASIYEALKIDYSIDDYDKNVREVVRNHSFWSGVRHRAYLLDRPWNQSFMDLDVVRVSNLKAYFHIVEAHLNAEKEAEVVSV